VKKLVRRQPGEVEATSRTAAGAVLLALLLSACGARVESNQALAANEHFSEEYNSALACAEATKGTDLKCE
jgi:hypothetical protein